MKEGCVATLDNIQLIPVDRLLRRAGWVQRHRWAEFCTSMAKVIAC